MNDIPATDAQLRAATAARAGILYDPDGNYWLGDMTEMTRLLDSARRDVRRAIRRWDYGRNGWRQR